MPGIGMIIMSIIIVILIISIIVESYYLYKCKNPTIVVPPTTNVPTTVI